MKTPRQRLEALLVMHQGRCAVRECSDLAIVAYDMEREKLVKITPQVDGYNTYKMIVVTKL